MTILLVDSGRIFQIIDIMAHSKARGRPVEEEEGDTEDDETTDNILTRDWIIRELYVRGQRQHRLVLFFSVVLCSTAVLCRADNNGTTVVTEV